MQVPGAGRRRPERLGKHRKKPQQRRCEPAEDDEGPCEECEGGGWIAYGTGHMDPHFRICDACHNPEGHPCP